MKDYNFKNILIVLSEASPSHLALASFVVFPVVLDYWLQAILKLFPELSLYWKVGVLIILIVIYIACLIWLAKDASTKRSLEVMRDLILGRLSSNGWTAMGFDSAKKILEESCTDKSIHEVIQSFPKVLRYVKLKVPNEQGFQLKDENGELVYKPGVALVKVENA